MSIELLTDNHRESVLNALGESQQRIYIVTPFIKKQPAHRLAQIIQKNKVDCVLISRFNYENFATGVSDIDALIELHQAGAKVLALKICIQTLFNRQSYSDTGFCQFYEWRFAGQP